MRRRWFIVFMLLVIWTGQISQLPIADTVTTDNEKSKNTERKTRQLNGKVCCPCPSSAEPKDLEVQADSWSASVLPAEELRSACDCPCRLRDSEAAASSMFDFPSQMRSVASFVRTSDYNEETKPLLHPEVGLANSVLQTLREATEEEYQEAVTRDAARAAPDPGSFESNPEAAKNIVTIILNPHPLPGDDDDIMASGTHTHESRCIHSPLGKSIFESSSIPRSNYLTEARHLPSLGRQHSGRSSLLHLDNGLSASNLHETVVESPETNKSERTKPFLNLQPKNKIVDSTKVLNNRSSLKNILRDSDHYNNYVLNSKIETDSDCKTSMSVKERVKKLNAILNSSPVDDMDGHASETINDQDLLDDTSDDEEKNGNINIGSHSIALPKKNVKSLMTPLIPNNIFNLKDVELIPTSRGGNINNDMTIKIPNFNIPSINDLIAKSKVRAPEIMNLPTLSDLFRTVLVPQKNTKIDEDVTENKDTSTDIANDSNEKVHKIHTEILDVIPSPSENLEMLSNGENFISESISRSAQNDDNKSQNQLQESGDNDSQHEISSTENIQQLNSTESVEVTSSTVDNNEIEDSNPDVNDIDTFSSEEESTENKSQDENEKLLSNNQPESNDTINNWDKIKDPLLDISNINANPAPTKDNRSEEISECHNQHTDMTMRNAERAEKGDIHSISGSSEEYEGINSREIINDSNELKSNNTCSSELLSSKSVDTHHSESLHINTGDNEMTVEASDPISSLIYPNKHKGLLGSLLKQSPLVQPLDLINPENGLLSPPSIDPLNLNIPTLNELREGLENIFGNNGLGRRDSENEFGTDGDIIETSMVTDSSAPNAKFTIPIREPAKEVNLNIVKINPLKLGEPLNLKTISSGLNLDSLTARLKMPSSTWKPIKLESTFGKGSGLLGASLSLEPSNKNRPSLLSSSGLNVPDLEKIRSTLRARTEDIIKTPKLSLNTVSLMDSEPVRQLDDLRQSIHSNAANAMSNFQQTLESRLNEAKDRTDNLFDNSRFAQPENLLDIARFDVDDKLQELHSNIADHLSSMHEKLMNKPTLPSLGSPLLGFPFDSSILGKSSPSWNRRKPTTKRKSSNTVQSSQKPTIHTGKFRTSTVSDKKPSFSKKSVVLNRNSENNLKIPYKDPTAVTSRMIKSNSMVTQKPIRLQSKKVKAGKSQQSRSKNRNPVIQSVRVTTLHPTPDIRRVMPPLLPRTSLRSDRDKFRAALFTTTTTRPRSASSSLPANSPLLLEPLPSKQRTSPQKTTNRNPGFKLLEMPHSRFQSLLQSIRDADGSPSEQVLTKTLPDFKVLKSTSFDSTNQLPDLLSHIIKPIFKVNISKMDLPERTGSFKPLSQTIKSSDFKEAEKGSSSVEEIDKFTKSNPNISNDTLLSKLRDSVRSMKSFVKDKENSVLEFPKDMTEGASENLQNIVVLDEPMKENVKYKCKMVCSRE